MTGFCVACGRYVPYSVVSERVNATIRGTSFEYVKVYAICDECGEKIYISEINDENVEKRRTAYDRAKKVIKPAFYGEKR